MVEFVVMEHARVLLDLQVKKYHGNTISLPLIPSFYSERSPPSSGFYWWGTNGEMLANGSAGARAYNGALCGALSRVHGHSPFRDRAPGRESEGRSKLESF